MVKGQKIRRVIEKYDLKDLDDELVKRWTDTKNGESLHELEQFVNQRIVEAIIEEELQGLVPQMHPTDQIARLLRADISNAERFEDVSQVEIREIKNWLEQNDINTAELTDDLVSYNTVYQYLKNVKEIDASEKKRQSRTPEERQEKVVSRLSNLRERVEAVTKQGLQSLVNANVIPDTYSIRLQFRIECTECDRRQDLFEYIHKRGCTSCNANNRSKNDPI